MIREARECEEERGEAVHIGERLARELAQSQFFYCDDAPFGAARKRPRDVEERGEFRSASDGKSLQFRNFFFYIVHYFFYLLHRIFPHFLIRPRDFCLNDEKCLLCIAERPR